MLNVISTEMQTESRMKEEISLSINNGMNKLFYNKKDWILARFVCLSAGGDESEVMSE